MDEGLWHCTGGGDQDHCQENKMQKGKMVVWGGLTNSWENKRRKRQRRKGKLYLSKCRVLKNSKRDKNAIISDQSQETEDNNRMRRTRDLFKKIRNTKGTFHAKTGTIKDRNSMDLTDAEETKKRWQEYTEKLYKNDFHDPDNHDGVITHLEPDILECEVKWASGSITTNKVSGGGAIPVELFQVLMADVVKVLPSMCQQIWKFHQWPQDHCEGQFSLQPQNRKCQRMFKLLHNCTHLTC